MTLLQLVPFCLLLSLSENAVGQNIPCSQLVKKVRSVKKSKTPIRLDAKLLGLDFSITSAKLEITDSGLPLTVQLSLTFGEKRFTFFPGDILTIYFADGSRDEFLYAVKQPDHGKVHFTLIKVENNFKKIVEEEDVLFYTKILDVNIISFKLKLNSPYVEMKISKENGDLIRATIACLMDY